MQESTNTRENGRSIWNDVSLFMTAGKRPEIAKNTVSGKLSSVRRAENKVHAPQHPVETKYIQKNQLNAAESAESLSSKKVKPVGRVIPINGQNLVDIEGRKTCNEKGVKSLIREESRNNRGSRAAPPTGSNNTSVPMEQLTTDTDSDIIDQTKPRDENHDPNNQGCMENRSTKGESDRVNFPFCRFFPYFFHFCSVQHTWQYELKLVPLMVVALDHVL